MKQTIIFFHFLKLQILIFTDIIKYFGHQILIMGEKIEHYLKAKIVVTMEQDEPNGDFGEFLKRYETLAGIVKNLPLNRKRFNNYTLYVGSPMFQL